MTELATTVPSERDHFLAVVERLRGVGGFAVGEGEAPAGPPPYVTVYPLEGGTLDGTIADVEADLVWPFQVTCVATTESEVLWLVDKVRSGVRQNTIAIADRRVLYVRSSGVSVPRRDDTVTPSVFYATPRFTLATSPIIVNP